MARAPHDDGATVDAAEARLDARDRQLHLVVLQDELVSTHPLPERGEVRIGRGEQNDIRIDHALISREHAILGVGPDGLELVDLSSRNGTWLRGERLSPNQRVEVSPGQVIEVGATMILVQESHGGPRAQRLSTHGYFEARLEEECARARARGAEVAILRIHAGTDPDEARAALGALLEPADLVARYAPGEYEVLLGGGGAKRAAELSSKLAARFPVDAVRVGVAVAPGDGRTADALLQRACAALRRTEAAPGTRSGRVVADPAMLDLYKVAERVAKGSISVLLLGETGVGKEVFAEAIHDLSPRREKKFVRINCAALTESLLESELFGHEKGAFTGADRAKPGLLEAADGGTVMLDELGEMPLVTQAKMLRVLEQRQVLRVGGLEPRKIDVRFVAATNRDLEAEVLAGRFRRDLYFRLNGVALVVPPLRERTIEIEALAERFVGLASDELGRDEPPVISARAMKLLTGYAWPGNIRELRNVMEPWERPIAARVGVEATDGDDEKQRILRALEACGGNQTRAAKMLGIGRRTLTDKLNKYQVPRPKKG
ncbi:sigma 54-interacting transcriptional regulator [Myxococcota bacterium]|nr:sigma 54-interacting transcriptional regulator [Myxococcota bacterium]